jgi:anti-anti-sigma factor
VTAICPGRRPVRLRNPWRDERALDGEPSPLEVVESREDGRTRVRLRGELDLVTAAAVAERLGVLARAAPDGLTFIDVSGVRLVLAAAEDLRRDGWSVAVTRGSRPVRRVFQVLELDKHLPYD